MKTATTFLFATLAALALRADDTGITGTHGYTPDYYVPVTDPAVLENIESFRDLKLGLMMHFGVYNQVGIGESWGLIDQSTWRSRTMSNLGDGDDFKRMYGNLYKTFNPLRFNADQWARTAERNGFKYLCFTTKHHDGFALWDTKYSDYKITNPECPYSKRKNADMVRDIWDAFRARGLKISCYFSKADWHHPDFWTDGGIGTYTDWYPTYKPAEDPARWARFEEFMKNQMVELSRDYGRIEIMWLDGASVGCRADTKVNMTGIMAECRKYQPWLIAADRCIRGENEQLITPEQTVPEKPLAPPWESCITMGSTWSYRFDAEYKSYEEIIKMFVGIVAKGGCLVLNVSPRPDGEIPGPALDRMNAMGVWLRANGDVIYGTRPVYPYSLRNWCFTQKNGAFYAIRCTRPGERDIQRITLNSEGKLTRQIKRIVHVATGRDMPFEVVRDGWRITYPEDIAPDLAADAFRIVFEEPNEKPYRVMGFNIWGPFFGNPVEEREDTIAAVVKKYAPDVLAVQEMHPKFWEAKFPTLLKDAGYTVIDRAADGKNNYVPLFYRKDRLTLIDSGFERFCPNLDASKAVSWGVFQNVKTGERFISFATHFWWRSDGKSDDQVRADNAEKLVACLRRVQAKYPDAPIVGGGDVNTRLQSWAMETLESNGFFSAQKVDPTAANISTNHKDPVRGADGKYHGFLRKVDNTMDTSIDHILVETNRVNLVKTTIVTDQDALDVSDHSPVVVDFKVK